MNTTKITAEQNRAAYIAALAAAIWEDSGFNITFAQAKAKAISTINNDLGQDHEHLRNDLQHGIWSDD